MARPKKNGLEYFPLDVDFSNDQDIRLLCIRHGQVSKLVMITIWAHIYKEHGCYAYIKDGVYEFMANDCGLTLKKFIAIVNEAIGLGLLVSTEDGKGNSVLTSHGMIKRYSEVLITTKRKDVIPAFITKLYSEVITEKTPVSTEETRVSTEETPVNSEISTQRKEKEIKEKENKRSTVSGDAEIIAYLNEKTGSSYKPTTQKTLSLIHAREEEGFTLEDFKAVIDHKQDQWGNDPKMRQYLRPETLFGTKFEGYLNDARRTQEGGVAYVNFGFKNSLAELEKGE